MGKKWVEGERRAENNCLSVTVLYRLARQFWQPSCAFTMDLHCYVIHFHTVSIGRLIAWLFVCLRLAAPVKWMSHSKHTLGRFKQLYEIGPLSAMVSHPDEHTWVDMVSNAPDGRYGCYPMALLWSDSSYQSLRFHIQVSSRLHRLQWQQGCSSQDCIALLAVWWK